MNDKGVPTALIVTDGKIGDLAQCRGVAAGLHAHACEVVVKPSPVYAFFAPWGPADLRADAFNLPIEFETQNPDFIIASGRRAISYARQLKSRWAGKTFVVLLKDPRIRAGFADLIWVPDHDRRVGANVFATLTSPHGFGDALNEAGDHRGDDEKGFLGVVLGGPSAGADYSPAAARDLARRIQSAAEVYRGVKITPSRRTPVDFLEAFSTELKITDAQIWDGAGENPYKETLANATTLIVAADSHNMVSEACASQAGVYVFRPAGMAKKLSWFVDQLQARGRVRVFEESAEPFTATPIDASGEICAEIRRRYAVRTGVSG